MLPDHTDRSENWVRSQSFHGRQVNTLSGYKWHNMNVRCTPGSIVQQKHPTYIGCVNNFRSFNDFVEWHRAQIGYGEFELDKDCLVKGNKIYSAETCILLPRSLNGALTLRHGYDLPKGVHSRGGTFQARCRDALGKPKCLGTYETAEEATSVYWKFKAQVVMDLAEIYRDRIDPRAYEALKSRHKEEACFL
jgi:hypothetical protein